MESPVSATGEAAVAGTPRTAVDAVIEVIVVVRFTNPSITKALPTVKVMKVSIKMMVEVAEEKKRREAHVKR
jgi:hypothetical protein